MSETSTKPYLLRALYEWCTDNGYTPHIVVKVDATTKVPMEFVNNGEIVLNISFGATNHLKMDNDYIHFRARFGGLSREIEVPIENVSAIYARENGQGMAFDMTKEEGDGRKKKKSSAKDAGAAKQDAERPPVLSAVPASETSLTEAPEKPAETDDDPNPPKKSGRPTLTRIK